MKVIEGRTERRHCGPGSEPISTRLGRVQTEVARRPFESYERDGGSARLSDSRFAVIIPAYNAEATLGLALRSVSVQTRPDFEVVVVSDGSTDGTADIAMAFSSDPRFRLVCCAHRGVAAARNAGIEESSAELVVFLDADDLLLPTYLEEMGTLASSHAESALFFTDAWIFDDETRRVARRTAMQANRPPRDQALMAERLFDELVGRNFVFVAATVRRSALDVAGGFDVTLSAAADWEMWLRLAASGFGSARSAQPLALYRRRSGQMSSDRARMTAEITAVFDVILRTYELSSAMRARAEARHGRAEEEVMALGETGHVRRRRRFDRLRRIAGRWRHWKTRVPKIISDALREG